MKRGSILLLGLALGACGGKQPGPAPARAPAPTGPLPVGTPAPDFTLASATMAGVGAKPVHLQDLRGKTVVIAFFYRARTKG
jgi:cytochrome oxidase Cu insertion factor (SCO1/SenC/PrrC family)